MPDLYIGKVFNPADKSFGDPFMLDSGDLTTHGIIIGMTGSGKTGLSVDIIEELLKSRVPVIVIDPKGDMGNLALAFDRLAPEQFEPWTAMAMGHKADPARLPEALRERDLAPWHREPLGKFVFTGPWGQSSTLVLKRDP